MAKRVIRYSQLRHYMAHFMDLGGHTNSFTASRGGNVLSYNEAHTESVRRVGGLLDNTMSFQGNLEHLTSPSLPDQAELLFEEVGTKFPCTAPSGLGQEGDRVHFGYTVENSFEISATVGELTPFTLDVPVDGPMIYGKVLRNRILNGSGVANPETGPATGNEIQLATVGEGELLGAAVHLVSFTGTNISFVIETDATGFASPVTRITLGPFTARGSAYGTNSGPITPDDFARVDVTGTFTSATFLVVAGVGRV